MSVRIRKSIGYSRRCPRVRVRVVREKSVLPLAPLHIGVRVRVVSEKSVLLPTSARSAPKCGHPFNADRVGHGFVYDWIVLDNGWIALGSPYVR